MKYPKVGVIKNVVEDKPLTTIASVILKDHILFACDSQETEEGKLVTSVHKLHELEPLNLVCAMAGELSVIRDFLRIIRPYCSQEKDLTWSRLREEATDQLNLLNKKKRRSVNDSGAKATSDDLGDVLFAGYLDSKSAILQITDKGEAYFWDEQNKFIAIGSGSANFMMAKITLESYLRPHGKDKDIFDRDHFRFFVALALQTDPISGSPLRFVKVTPKGVEWLEGQEKSKS